MNMPEHQPQLSDEELIALRQVLQDAARATWLRKQIFIIAPIVFSIVTGVLWCVNWIASNLRWKV